MNAMALISTSYLEGRMCTSIFGSSGIGSSELISGFGSLETSSACRTGKCSSKPKESISLL